ncbi:uncharacterized protein PHA67_000903 [Liasis olivaceus]
MGVHWQLVFGCFLLVGRCAQNLSAQELVEEEPAREQMLEEELENITMQRITSLREKGNDQIHTFIDLALQYYNNKQNYSVLFTPVGDATMTVKKAVGSMVHLRLSLEKTNCTKKDVKLHDSFYMPSLSYFEEDDCPPLKYCGPLPPHEEEQLDCMFDMFKDERSSWEAVVSHDCRPVRVVDF